MHVDYNRELPFLRCVQSPWVVAHKSAPMQPSPWACWINLWGWSRRMWRVPRQGSMRPLYILRWANRSTWYTYSSKHNDLNRFKASVNLVCFQHGVNTDCQMKHNPIAFMLSRLSNDGFPTCPSCVSLNSWSHGVTEGLQRRVNELVCTPCGACLHNKLHWTWQMQGVIISNDA